MSKSTYTQGNYKTYIIIKNKKTGQYLGKLTPNEFRQGLGMSQNTPICTALDISNSPSSETIAFVEFYKNSNKLFKGDSHESSSNYQNSIRQ